MIFRRLLASLRQVEPIAPSTTKIDDDVVVWERARNENEHLRRREQAAQGYRRANGCLPD